MAVDASRLTLQWRARTGDQRLDDLIGHRAVESRVGRVRVGIVEDAGEAGLALRGQLRLTLCANKKKTQDIELYTV